MPGLSNAGVVLLSEPLLAAPGYCKRHSEKPFGLELRMHAITLLAGRLQQTHFLKLAGKADEATSGQQQCEFRNRRSVTEQEDSHRDAGKRHRGRD
jgi:hypothetical protein